jgi:hypothetical protein
MAWIFLSLALVSAPATLTRIVGEGADSAIRQRLEVVIRTTVEWEALWGRLASGKSPEPVDFSHEMVVGVFAGSRSSSGSRVEIVSVAREHGDIVVRYREHRPAGSASNPPLEMAPYQLVAIPRDRRHVKFLKTVDLPAGRF